MGEIAVVSTALGVSSCCCCCEDKLECVPGGGVNIDETDYAGIELYCIERT